MLLAVRFNARLAVGLDRIPEGHVRLGMSSDPGALEDMGGFIEKEHFTDDEIIVQGWLEGKHTGNLGPAVPTNAQISLPFIAVYRFDAAGKLAGEFVVMNMAPFGTGVNS